MGALAIAVLLRFDANLHALLGPGAILGLFILELGLLQVISCPTGINVTLLKNRHQVFSCPTIQCVCRCVVS